MKTVAIGIILCFFVSPSLFAQRECRTAEYEQQQFAADPSLINKKKSIESAVLQPRSSTVDSRTSHINIIKIPVVVHILYHTNAQAISDAQVQSQIDALNRDYRKLNKDALSIPARFAGFAADCEIEFALATRDPKGRSTSGVVRKYSPVTEWTMDDNIKLSSKMGDDAWDAASYLNIWVGNLHKLAGYASVLGGPPEKDGVVINSNAFGTINTSAPYNMGRTAVHEVGHWLGLKHTWGDADCGDDGIYDTPQQRSYTTGCPTGIRITCGNAPDGDMYMNYMDFTNDACLLMFTNGQKEKMRNLFAAGGYRYSILSSKGLSEPVMDEIPVEQTGPQWLQVKIYPNPVTTELIIDVAYDERWVGKQIAVINMMGQVQLKKIIGTKIEKVDVSKLKHGIYFIKGNKDGEVMMQKFVKM
jgi:Pregnancy-associated plasma protein-A/Secretion system C-terminal sorting domain